MQIRGRLTAAEGRWNLKTSCLDYIALGTLQYLSKVRGKGLKTYPLGVL